MKKILCISLMMVFICGCATAELRKTVTDPNGMILEYIAKISTIGMDSKAADIKVSLDPSGKNTIKAGAIEKIVSPVTADATANFVELVKVLVPLIKTATPPP